MDYNDKQGWLRIHNTFIWVADNVTKFPPEEWGRLGTWTFVSTFDGDISAMKSKLLDAVFGPDRSRHDDVNVIALQGTPLRHVTIQSLGTDAARLKITHAGSQSINL